MSADGIGTPRRLRLGMVGGGQGAFIGAVHRIAARLDDRYELVAGAFASDPDRARASAAELHVGAERAYTDFVSMAEAEAARSDGIDAVAIVVPNHLHRAAAEPFVERGIHVICEKPMATTLVDARHLVERARSHGVLFAVTHNYTGYPMVRQARTLVADGALGQIRTVQVEYAQEWLATKLEDQGVKQAEWRTDPARSGQAGAVGDIGSHAFHLARFVTGLELEALTADLSTFVPGRRLDDNAQMLLRYANGARGSLWCSQVAVGRENGLVLRVYGDAGGLEWRQEDPNTLHVTALGGPVQRYTRAGPGAGHAQGYATRIPAGHPEGFLEAFAQLYADAAEQIHARLANRATDPSASLLPIAVDGAASVAFVEAAVASGQHDGAWTDVAPVEPG
jgi:predicted dehydrogenase